MLWLPNGEAGVEPERARLVGLCYRLTGDAFAADDLAQETLLEALRSQHAPQDPDNYSRWLSGIARNVCRRWARERASDLRHLAPTHDDSESLIEGLPAEEPDVEIELERSELADLLDRALAMLPADTRDVLVQRYIEDSPHSEIAQRLGLSEGAVAVRLQRGRLALHRVLRAEFAREAGAYGFLHAEGAWEETLMWCPVCGRRRLVGRVSREDERARLALRCAECTPEGYTLVEGDLPPERYRRVLGDARDYRSAMLAVGSDLRRLLVSALPRGEARCAGCGRILPLKLTNVDGGHGLSIWCDRCRASTNTSPLGLALSLPEGRAFWREHPRMSALPDRELESQGEPALVTSFESATDTSRLEVIFSLRDYQVLAVHGAPRR